jgi:hypothetical protein
VKHARPPRRSAVAGWTVPVFVASFVLTACAAIVLIGSGTGPAPFPTAPVASTGPVTPPATLPLAPVLIAENRIGGRR